MVEPHRHIPMEIVEHEQQLVLALRAEKCSKTVRREAAQTLERVINERNRYHKIAIP